jgi:hypothetical protein
VPISTQTAQPIPIRIGPGECHRQHGGVVRCAFGRFDELVELALVGPRPIHHPSGATADRFAMLER